MGPNGIIIPGGVGWALDLVFSKTFKNDSKIYAG